MNDCVFCKGNKCAALSEKQCIGCHFYKTDKELKKGRQKASERIRTLPPDIQTHIHQKYYARRSTLE